MNRTIRRIITESYSDDNVNSVPSKLESRTITEFNEEGIPTEEETNIFDEDPENGLRTRRYDEKGRPSLDFIGEDVSVEYSYEETPDGNTICREKSISPGNPSFTDIHITDADGREISSDMHYDEDVVCHTEIKYDSEGRLVEIIRNGENWSHKTHHFYKYDRTADGNVICESKAFDGEGKTIFHSVSRTTRDGNVETAITKNLDENGNLESEEMCIVEFIKDGNGDEYVLHEECWEDGKQIYETIYEYADDDFNSVTVTEKRFDLNCIEVSKTTVEYWD